MLEAVIFDMDGVIVDTEPGYFEAVVLNNRQMIHNMKELLDVIFELENAE